MLRLDGPIEPGKAVGDVHLGMAIAELLPMIEAAGPANVTVRAYYPRLLTYVYRDSMEICVDVLCGDVVRIDVYGDYIGAYRDRVRVGAHVAELKALRSDLSFDEEYILVGEDWGLILKLEDEIEDLDSIDNEIIELITIEQRGWVKRTSPSRR